MPWTRQHSFLQSCHAFRQSPVGMQINACNQDGFITNLLPACCILCIYRRYTVSSSFRPVLTGNVSAVRQHLILSSNSLLPSENGFPSLLLRKNGFSAVFFVFHSASGRKAYLLLYLTQCPGSQFSGNDCILVNDTLQIRLVSNQALIFCLQR